MDYIEEKTLNATIVKPYISPKYDAKYIYGNGKMTEKTIPTYSGLYLIGEINYEDDTNYLVYKVKIGKGKNLKNRLKTYITYSTSVKLFDTCYVHDIVLDKEEERMHDILDKYCWHVGDTEWCVVSRENYQILKKYGFNGINKLKKV